MKHSPEQLKEMMAGKTNDELYVTLYTHSHDYTPEAIEAARAEFDRRQLAAPPESVIRADVEKVRQQEQTPLSSPLRIVAFFVSTAFFFIPVILAMRHFSKKGEIRKANDWGNWAAFGFIFYTVLAVILRVLAMRRSPVPAP